MENKDKYQQARDLLERLNEKCKNGEEMTEEESMKGFDALFLLFGSRIQELPDQQNNME